MKKALMITVLLLVGIFYVVFRLGPPATKPENLPSPTPTVNPAISTVPNETPLSAPPGFGISYLAKNLPGVRDLEPIGNGKMFASLPNQGQVVLISRIAEPQPAVKVIIPNLNRPHGLAYKNGKLYVAETNQVSVYGFDVQNDHLSQRNIVMSLPSGGNHWTRSLLIQGDKLYVSIGSSCNVCREQDLRRASILVSDLDGENPHSFATGLRNSVFMTVKPGTNEIWATDMGRDFLGDNLPPDEVNIIRENQDYGWPVCYGKNVHDSNFDRTLFRATVNANICAGLGKTASQIDIPAHSAPLGLAFVPSAWPSPYAGQLLVAYHGSWNRSVPTGHKVVALKLDGTDGLIDQIDFLTGFMNSKNNVIGRPVDLVVVDNILYISDDKAGVVYQVKPL